MVEVIRDISGLSRPCYRGYVKFTCDGCGCQCDQDGNYTDKLYWYDTEQLCANCIADKIDKETLMEILVNAEIIEQVK